MTHPRTHPTLPRRARSRVAQATAAAVTSALAVLTVGVGPAAADNGLVLGADGEVRAERPAAAEVDTPAEQRAERRQERKQEQRELEEDRQIALAAAWKVDPSLLVAQPGDSPETVAARGLLAEVSARLEATMTVYDRAVAVSDRAQEAATQAAEDLVLAEVEEAAAERQAAADQAALIAIATSTYKQGSMGPLAVMLSADNDDALYSGMTLLTQVGLSQTDALAAAEASARRLEAARVAVAERGAQAREKLAAATRALAAATEARDAVLVDVRRARRLLQQSVVIDRLIADVDADEVTATSARAAAELKGGVAFPLPLDAAIRDNNNWGRAGKLWAKGHTGNDFSAACGTPVYAATRGTVEIRTDQGWAGRWLVMVDTGEGLTSTWYAHMQRALVEDGDKVKAGDPIGLVGDLGNSTGCHLHFEVHAVGGSIYEDNIDPVAWLRIARAYPKSLLSATRR